MAESFRSPGKDLASRLPLNSPAHLITGRRQSWADSHLAYFPKEPQISGTISFFRQVPSVQQSSKWTGRHHMVRLEKSSSHNFLSASTCFQDCRKKGSPKIPPFGVCVFSPFEHYSIPEPFASENESHAWQDVIQAVVNEAEDIDLTPTNPGGVPDSPGTLRNPSQKDAGDTTACSCSKAPGPEKPGHGHDSRSLGGATLKRLLMDEIQHHFENMRNHYLLVFTLESWCRILGKTRSLKDG